MMAAAEDTTLADDRLQKLFAIESQLTRSFLAAVMALAANIIYVFFIAKPAPDGGVAMTPTVIVLGLVQLACYVRYAVAAGAGATAIGESGWKYVIWILAAPFLARLPI